MPCGLAVFSIFLPNVPVCSGKMMDEDWLFFNRTAERRLINKPCMKHNFTTFYLCERLQVSVFSWKGRMSIVKNWKDFSLREKRRMMAGWRFMMFICK